MSNLSLPLIIWSGPPEHKIKNIICNKEGNKIATLSISGEIIIWNVNINNERILINIIELNIIPFAYLDPPYSDFSLIAIYKDKKDILIGVCDNADVITYDLNDGVYSIIFRCLNYSKNLLHGCEHPCHIRLLNPTPYAVVCNQSNVMEIFNCETHEYISFAAQSNDWLIDICPIGRYLNINDEKKKNEYVYITLGADNRLYVWIFNGKTKKCHPSTNVLISDDDDANYMY